MRRSTEGAQGIAANKQAAWLESDLAVTVNCPDGPVALDTTD